GSDLIKGDLIGGLGSVVGPDIITTGGFQGRVVGFQLQRIVQQPYSGYQVVVPGTWHIHPGGVIAAVVVVVVPFRFGLPAPQVGQGAAGIEAVIELVLQNASETELIGAKANAVRAVVGKIIGNRCGEAGRSQKGELS